MTTTKRTIEEMLKAMQTAKPELRTWPDAINGFEQVEKQIKKIIDEAIDPNSIDMKSMQKIYGTIIRLVDEHPEKQRKDFNYGLENARGYIDALYLHEEEKRTPKQKGNSRQEHSRGGR